MDARPSHQLPPSLFAARRDRQTPHPVRKVVDRAYPLVEAGSDHHALNAQVAATRALVRASSEDEVAQVVATLVRDLGGAVVPARLATASQVLPCDVSFGRSEPMLPWAEPVSLAAMRLSAVLPAVMEDAHLTLARLQAEVQRDHEATRDLVTGLLTRRAWMRRLFGAGPGDSVALIDLDQFKAVNDTHGHEVGDVTLRAVGRLLDRSFRGGDLCGRYGGDELGCLTPGTLAPVLVERCEGFARRWEQVRPAPAAGVTLSIGVAAVDERGGRAALRRADRALYRAKAAGRDRVVLAGVEDDDELPAL